MKNETSSEISELDISFKADIERNSFHTIGFIKEIEKQDNNFFNSTIHCLTNICPLVSLILATKDSNHPFIILLEQIQEESKKNKDEIDISDIEYCLMKLKEYMGNQYHKVVNNPKTLINYILKDFQESNLITQGNLKELKIICKSCENKSMDDVKIIEFNFPKIINNYINKKNNITIYDCFQYYFKSLFLDPFICDICHQPNKSSGIIFLPKILMIFIDFGNKNNYKISYEFDEIINFKEFDFINNEDKNREFFLSSIIACINLGDYFETYYTFARDNETSLYYIYNGNDVRGNMKVTNKIKKKEINLKNKKESWPFVLVYIDKN